MVAIVVESFVLEDSLCDMLLRPASRRCSSPMQVGSLPATMPGHVCGKKVVEFICVDLGKAPSTELLGVKITCSRRW